VGGCVAGGHRELLCREHVMWLLDAGGIGGEALVAGADAELLGRQHVVRLVDSARVLGHAGVSLVHEPHRATAPARYGLSPMDEASRTEFEAAAFRRLVKHLRERTDVQNIDLMELAGFCRNCLSRWYREEAEERGMELSDPEAREIVYGMPYEEWKSKHQTSRPAA
jgi:uncharacterized protein